MDVDGDDDESVKSVQTFFLNRENFCFELRATLSLSDEKLCEIINEY